MASFPQRCLPPSCISAALPLVKLFLGRSAKFWSCPLAPRCKAVAVRPFWVLTLNQNTRRTRQALLHPSCMRTRRQHTCLPCSVSSSPLIHIASDLTAPRSRMLAVCRHPEQASVGRGFQIVIPQLQWSSVISKAMVPCSEGTVHALGHLWRQAGLRRRRRLLALP